MAKVTIYRLRVPKICIMNEFGMIIFEGFRTVKRGQKVIPCDQILYVPEYRSPLGEPAIIAVTKGVDDYQPIIKIDLSEADVNIITNKPGIYSLAFENFSLRLFGDALQVNVLPDRQTVAKFVNNRSKTLLPMLGVNRK